jgi:hypothetical protein
MDEEEDQRSGDEYESPERSEEGASQENKDDDPNK